jgi:hypothetical protein
MCAWMAVSPGLETAQNNNEKRQATSDVFKRLSVVIALCLLPTGRTNLGKKLIISKQNRKRKVL